MNDLDLTSAHSDSATGRQRAREFLLRLEKHLERGLPEASNVVEGILKTQREARQRGKTGSEAYEGPFFKSHVIPAVHSFLIAEGLTRDEAIKALLAEGYLDLLGYASGTPASKRLYPFKKSIAATLKDARKAWWEDGKVLFNSCPDLALRSPCEHSVVFEGKLFRSDSLEVAKSAIVAGIFESFFYRALPTLTGKNAKTSSYKYACFLAYDASRSLCSARSKINKCVIDSCWEDLNIYVMILPLGKLVE